MPDDITIEIQGLDELAKKLDELPYKTAAKIMRPALQASGEVFRQAAAALAPVSPQAAHRNAVPGELRNSIIAKVRLGTDLDSNSVRIGPAHEKAKYTGKERTHSPGVYGMFVEYGTKKMSAHPFMRPAFEAAKERAVEAFVQVVRDLLELVVSEDEGKAA